MTEVNDRLKIERVSLIGLGAMGSFFAPRLYENLDEGCFHVIAAGERKKRLEEKGVTLNGKGYRFPVVEPQDSSAPADLVIMAVKDRDLDQAVKDIGGQMGERTQILCVMNGVVSEERVAAVYGWGHVLYSFMRVTVVMNDGVADYDPDKGCVHFGEKRNDTYSERVIAVKEVFERCGIPYIIDADMIKGLWFKFMSNVGENMTSTLLGIPFGVYTEDEDANWIRRAAMREVLAIAHKKGIDIGEEEIQKQETVFRTLPYENKPSTLQDLEKGKKTEVEMFSGTVVRMGEELGIDTPVNRVLYHGIRALEEKNSRGRKI